MDDDETETLVRELAADLAEAWVERAGEEEGFEVWDDDGDVQSFTGEAQDRFDAACNRIEPELRHYVRDPGATDAEAILVEALVGYAAPDRVRAVAAQLTSARNSGRSR